MGDRSLRLFEGFGVELEYMIVARGSFDVAPIADRLMYAVAGEYCSEIEQGALSWSNELCLHVIELKTNGPAASLTCLASAFHEHIVRINGLLSSLHARLMPTAMHPWMDPHTQMRLWPHEYSAVYESFDRIFGCHGHGWANLQSMHLNLPFAGDEEFGRLHAAIRLLLPILPALAASSPVMDGRLTGAMDNRLHVYRSNAARVPSVSGRVIPEPVFTRHAYEREILERIYADIAPHDSKGILQHEWLNARGAIARFDRSAIEIRVLDMQECPQADLAVAKAVVAVLRGLVEERWSPWGAQQSWPIEPLERMLLATIRDAERALIDDPAYLRALGCARSSCTAGDLWRDVLDRVIDEPSADGESSWVEAVQVILRRGTLARRITDALGPSPSADRLRAVYGELCDCLSAGTMFRG